MKTAYVIFFLSMFSAVWPLENIAVLDFTANNVSSADANILLESFTSDLVSAGKFTVIERRNMEKILAEQSFQLSGCTDTACAVQAGKLLNIKYIVTGSLNMADSGYILILYLIDVESGKILISKTASAKNITVLMKEAGKTAARMSVKNSGADTGIYIEKKTDTSGSVSKTSSPTTGFTPMQFGLTAPLQIFPRDFSVFGLSVVMVVGRNKKLIGVGYAIINIFDESVYGLQSGIMNKTGLVCGLQEGILNFAETINGGQIGIYNRGGTVRGCQIGIVNSCERLFGVQIGIANFNKQSRGTKFMPIINIGF